MKLETGKCYKTRDGTKVSVVASRANPRYPFTGYYKDRELAFTTTGESGALLAGGTVAAWGGKQPCDIVAEWGGRTVVLFETPQQGRPNQ